MQLYSKLSILLFFLMGMPVQAQLQEPLPVTFTTEDGGTIHADLYRRGEHSVILAHGAIFNKESWQPLAQLLANHGYSVLAINFRGYGKSTPGSEPAALYEDILGAIQYLRKQQKSATVAVIGASMGGGAAARAAAKEKIDKLILLSAVPVAHPEKMQGNILFIASKNEAMAKQIQAQYAKAPEPKQIKWIDGSAHAQHIFKTEQNDTLKRIIIDFLKN
jgi:pimeloyl-ACP methyl ester carboxylesterase